MDEDEWGPLDEHAKDIARTGNQQPAQPAAQPASSGEAPTGAALVGHRVRMHDLVSRSDLNGCYGVVSAYDDAKGRCQVDVEGGAWGKGGDGSWAKSKGGGTFNLKPSNLTAVESLVGQRVRITGLEGRHDLNGSFGWARSFDAGKGRYLVELQKGGEQFSLRPANVRPEAMQAKDFIGADWGD